MLHFVVYIMQRTFSGTLRWQFNQCVLIRQWIERWESVYEDGRSTTNSFKTVCLSSSHVLTSTLTHIILHIVSKFFQLFAATIPLSIQQITVQLPKNHLRITSSTWEMAGRRSLSSSLEQFYIVMHGKLKSRKQGNRG